MTTEEGYVYGLKVDFDRDSPDPARVFRTMTDMIESLQAVDAGLLKGVGVKVHAVARLDDIQRGSLKTWIRVLIQTPSDEVLASGDVKKYVGAYLVKARAAVVKYMDKGDAVQSRQDLIDLRSDVGRIAKETGVANLGIYSPPQDTELVDFLQRLSRAKEPLAKSDQLAYLPAYVPEGETPAPGAENAPQMVNLNFNVDQEKTEALLTDQTRVGELRRTLIIKKPDLLGQSQWDFRHDKEHINARIEDQAWLALFHAKKISLSPGDALDCDLKSEVRYGYAGQVIGQRYTVTKVYGKLELEPDQLDLGY